MGILLVLFAAVALSVWTAEKEEELEIEMSRRYCPFCGAEMLEDDEFCVVCGTPVSAGEKIYDLELGVGVEEHIEEEELDLDLCDECDMRDECADYCEGGTCICCDYDNEDW